MKSQTEARNTFPSNLPWLSFLKELKLLRDFQHTPVLPIWQKSQVLLSQEPALLAATQLQESTSGFWTLRGLLGDDQH